MPPELIAGRYRVQERIGLGGMSEVYLADDLPAQAGGYRGDDNRAAADDPSTPTETTTVTLVP